MRNQSTKREKLLALISSNKLLIGTTYIFISLVSNVFLFFPHTKDRQEKGIPEVNVCRKVYGWIILIEKQSFKRVACSVCHQKSIKHCDL